MEEQKEILQPSDDPLSADSVAKLSSAAHDGRRRLRINLLVFAVAIPALLRYSSGGNLLLASWNLSLFAVSYLFYCMCFFSAKGTRLANIFVTLFYVGLLAFFARSLLSSVLGMVIMYLDSVLAAGLFSATLAQHRESNGTETAAMVAVANARAINKKLDVSRKDVYLLIGFMAMCYVPLLVWLMLVDSTGLGVAVSLFGGIAYIQIFDISCVLGWLNGAVFTSEDDSVKVILYFGIVFLIFFIVYLLAGEIAAVTVLWLCILASTSFHGYYHQIHASYEEIMSRSEPAATETPPLEEILVV